MKRSQLSAVVALSVLSFGLAPVIAAPTEPDSSAKPATKMQPIVNTWYKFQLTPVAEIPLTYTNMKTGSQEAPPKDVKWSQIEYGDWSMDNPNPVRITVSAFPHPVQTYAAFRKYIRDKLRLGAGKDKFKPGVSVRNNVPIGKMKGYEMIFDTNPGKPDTMRTRIDTVYANGYAYNFFFSADDLKGYRKFAPGFNKMLASLKLLK